MNRREGVSQATLTARKIDLLTHSRHLRGCNCSSDINVLMKIDLLICLRQLHVCNCSSYINVLMKIDLLTHSRHFHGCSCSSDINVLLMGSLNMDGSVEEVLLPSTIITIIIVK